MEPNDAGETIDEAPLQLVDHEDARHRAELAFDQVRLLLADAIPHSDIRHVGATAVPGCLTKGDLDLVVRVMPGDFEQADSALSRLYPRNDHSARTGAFSAFEDASSDPHLGVQLVVIDGPFDFFHQFVEVLNKSPELLRAYNDLKRKHVGHDMDVYRRAKDAFVEKALADLRVRHSR